MTTATDKISKNIDDAIFTWKSGFTTGVDFTHRRLSPSRYNRAIKEGYIRKEKLLGRTDYWLTEKGKQRWEEMHK